MYPQNHGVQIPDPGEEADEVQVVPNLSTPNGLADVSAARGDLEATTRSGKALAGIAVIGFAVLGAIGFVAAGANGQDDGASLAVAGIAVEQQPTTFVDDPTPVDPTAVDGSAVELGAADANAPGAETLRSSDEAAATGVVSESTERGVPRPAETSSDSVVAGDIIDPLAESDLSTAAEGAEQPQIQNAAWATLPTPAAGQLPIPDLLPLDPYAATEEVIIGTLEIPVLGVSQVLQQGMTLTAINRGPSHWPGTAAPGQQGNVVIAGHRTTNGAPFNGLDKLNPGDAVIFTTLDGVFTYAVREIEIVTPDALHIADQTEHAEATLFACHPKGSAAQRIVARLDLLGAPTNAPEGLDPLNAALGS